MRCIVTGGSGFIGSHLVDLLLERGHEVIVIDIFKTSRQENLLPYNRSGLKIAAADIRLSSEMKRIFSLGPVDWIFHLAALADIVPSIDRPRDYFTTNVDGTYEVLEAARAAGAKRFVYAASSSCYGLADPGPTPETAEIRPQYPYALTKRMGEELAFHWGQVYRLPVVSLRFFNVYGPRARTSGSYGAVFGVFLAQKLAGAPLTIVGDGTQSRDFVHVRDVARALLAAAESKADGRAYNVGTGKPVSVNRIAELIGGETTNIPKRPGEPDVTHADISRIVADLGWHPRTPIEEGVAEMLARIEEWRQAPVWTPEKIASATAGWFTHLGRGD